MSTRLWDKGQALDTKIHRFTVGRDFLLDRELAAFDAVASAAHARMLCSIGILTESECRELLGGLKQVYQKSENDEFEVPIEYEDCHTAIEVFLCESFGDSGKKIHTGRSRNDQVLVALRLLLRSETIRHLGLLQTLIDSLVGKAKEHLLSPFPGYTHMQRAMPTTVATYLLAYAEHAESLMRDGLTLYESLNWNPLGAASGFGAPIDLDRAKTTDLLAFQGVQYNPIYTQASRGREELKLLSWLVDIGGLIEKAACDLMLFCTSEFGLIEVSVEYTTGSSIMPQKRNPDVLELLRGSASRIRAAHREVEGASAKLPSSYHRDLQYCKEPLFRGVRYSHQALDIFTRVFQGLEFNLERGRETFTQELFATHQAYELAESGIPFREAYREAAKLLDQGQIDVEGLTEKFLEREKERNQSHIEALVPSLLHLQSQVNALYEREQRVRSNIFDFDGALP